MQSIAFSPDGRTFAAVTFASLVGPERPAEAQLWDVGTRRRLVVPLQGHTGAVDADRRGTVETHEIVHATSEFRLDPTPDKPGHWLFGRFRVRGHGVGGGHRASAGGSM